MKCTQCGRKILDGAYMVVRQNDQFVPVHRDCQKCPSYSAPRHKKKTRCRVTKALRNYREEHKNENDNAVD
ncbi:hypothetical protein AB840_15050 [Megasphaera cerevisiae DSM 20462]|uniref:Uncharacterized protein n=1 Tax=Megasphaera cerevisiae DSM 20462 TaxID=1122219 RepID=A0A0J6WP67_9FIRM|nr:hypothetical protein [Megasphaera cerevisiae]KMO85180.1 hypothetical protein AB840_15050 [Megasphaera cerevisiae DSM 20462]SKA27931.1 hypothetical protein SAMN05660900_03157 [Megasphaera cerevisiae DSM 20462]